jgi:hypothetical protein
MHRHHVWWPFDTGNLFPEDHSSLRASGREIHQTFCAKIDADVARQETWQEQDKSDQEKKYNRIHDYLHKRWGKGVIGIQKTAQRN